jgi:hypothetical protein
MKKLHWFLSNWFPFAPACFRWPTPNLLRHGVLIRVQAPFVTSEFSSEFSYEFSLIFFGVRIRQVSSSVIRSTRVTFDASIYLTRASRLRHADKPSIVLHKLVNHLVACARIRAVPTRSARTLIALSKLVGLAILGWSANRHLHFGKSNW